MNPKIQKLMNDNPLLFKENPPRSGCWVGDGWIPLLENLCSVLEYHITLLPEELRKDTYVVQIKEKFGGLCFYMNQSTPYMDGAIYVTEALSTTICEECGLPGEKRGGGWIKTLCNKHHKANEKKKKA